MSATLIVFLGTLALLVFLALLGARAAGPRYQRGLGIREEERRMAAQAEVEEHDIEEMLEARAALRKRLGKSSIGDELAREALREDERDE